MPAARALSLCGGIKAASLPELGLRGVQASVIVAHGLSSC